MTTMALLITLALGLLVTPLAAEAQPAGKMPRIGFLRDGGSHLSCSHTNFLRALHELGYVEGRNISIEWRCAEGKDERARQFAGELVQLGVDLIVCSSRVGSLAAKAATSTLPIIFFAGGDPVPALVASLARPGANVTGATNIVGWEFFAKHLQLLMEAVPGVTRVALLLSAGDPFNAERMTPVETAARAVGVHLHPVEVEVPHGFEVAFSAMTRQGVGGLLVGFDAKLNMHGAQIADLAAKTQLPAIAERREFAEQGGLMSYGASFAYLWQQVADYVDRILKGAKPADLPVVLPTKHELVINLKTAQALGLTIPPTLLFQADEILR